MTNSFFVILPSNTPGFVGNKTNKFKVHLLKKLQFDGAGWMVGLSGIIYPNSWAKLGTSDRQYVIVHLHDGRKYRFRVPKGSFLSPQQLERGIHHGMIAEVERLLTRKRSAPVHASFGNGDDDEEEGEILDVSFVEEEEETGEAPLHPLSNLTKLSAEQETLRHEKLAQEERRRREEEQRKQREAERKRREEEEKRRKAEDNRRKAAEKAAREKKAKEEKDASEKKAREEKLAREKKEEQRIAKEKKGEKEALGKKAEEERVAKTEADRVAKAEAERVAKAEAEIVAKAEEERLAKAEAERVALETKAEEERVTKTEEERVANETKKKQEEKQTAELQRQQLATRKQKELELLKEFRPWRGGYMRLLHGKDPTPDVHYLHETDDYHFVNAVFVCTEFKLKKVADDGVVVDVPANAAVGLIQMPGATFIRNLKVHINQREVYDSNQLYSYKVFMDTELSYPVAAKEAYFGVAGYFRDSDPTKVNDKRKKAVEESKSFQAISKLSADIFNQDLYMISNVEIDIELALQSDDFMIHQEAANRDKYTLEVVDCRLIVKTVDLMDGLSLDIAKKLDMEPARYGIRKTLMKSLFITGGRYDFSANLFTEEVPRRVIIGLVPNQNYIGHNQKNPFYFNHHNVRDIELTASGRTYPQFPYNLDYKNNRYARAYHDTQEHLGMACTTESNGISYSMFKTAYCLYVFQMTNSQEDSPGFELIKEGVQR
ncbi:hypothetical protein niasHT_020410 [Heterodera trifolii]|uniref:Uncharacterized protein n=1 Tax=Heterodera trifolii TaxID=157864 RepID=A0ABD2JXW9_9BILA